MRVAYVRGAGPRYRSVLHRGDGVIVELDGGSYNRVGSAGESLPHDLAHFVVEERLGLRSGLYGVLSAGGLFGHTKVVAGRQAPHAARRAQAIVERAREPLLQAEMLTRAVSDLALAGKPTDVRALRAALGERWWLPTVTADALEGACAGLQAMALRWHALTVDAKIELTWRLAPPPARHGAALGWRR